jgi:hypothetical protein
LTVNRAFKGLYLEKPGEYHIEFVYRPRYWRMSCALFWIAFLGVAAIVAGGARRTDAARSAHGKTVSNNAVKAGPPSLTGDP